ncbi:F-box protein CPR1-like [Mercurialis annua]|uniref:F-box protein CPR1-like n=1 Tax=Mercurialis annua TaxID=3986 RepID=UPI0021602C7E|nr:F-box protein CPR1-like [Mercurialis annua]
MSDLPLDIISDILKLLPVKSLLRFRCLSKSYCSLIDSRDFIILHLSQSNNTNANRNFFIVQPNKYDCMNNEIYTVNLDYSNPHLAECDHNKINTINLDYLVGCDHPFSIIPEDIWECPKTCLIFGSCNGLVALYHPQRGMFLWNLSTKRHRKLPDFWGRSQEILSSCYILDGFGYDPVSDDYKLVRIRAIDRKRRKGSIALVYSVKHNSSRRIEDFNYNVSRYRNCGTLVGSCLHWIVSQPRNSSDQLIVGFNLEDEKYREIPIPDFDDKLYKCKELGELGGRLSMSVDENYKSVGIWVMKEYGVRDSWIQIFSVCKANLKCVKPIGYSKTGHKLLLHVGGPKLYLLECDLQGEESQTSQQNHISGFNQARKVSDKRVRRINILEAGKFSRFDSTICVSSLVPVHV